MSALTPVEDAYTLVAWLDSLTVALLDCSWASLALEPLSTASSLGKLIRCSVVPLAALPC